MSQWETGGEWKGEAPSHVMDNRAGLEHQRQERRLWRRARRKMWRQVQRALKAQTPPE